MNFVQFHIGKELSDFRLNIMKKNINLLNSDDKFFLISEKNFLIYDNNVIWNDKNIIWIDINDIINNMLIKYESLNNYWNILKVENKCDFLRFYVATYMDDYLYLDTDCYLIDRINNNNNNILFCKYSNLTVDLFLFYSNNKQKMKDIFDNIIIYFDKYKHLNNISEGIFYKIFNQVIKNLNIKYEIINKDIYEHIRGE